MINIKLGFIGAGKVGFSLGKYFKDNKLSVIGYYSKNYNSALEASKFTNTKAYKDIPHLLNECDVILITTTDDSISSVWDQLRKLPIKGKIICHCSGAKSSQIFSNISKYGAYGYSIHPMFAISSKYNSYKYLSKAFFTIEGHEKYIYDLKKLINTIGNQVIIISAEKKKLYHLASVNCSNLVLALISKSIEYLEQCGFSCNESIEALYPLIENNIKSIKDNGVIASLTGPVERGDIETIKSHCNVISDYDQKVYMLLCNEVLKIAKVKNKNKNYEKISEYIGERI